MEFNRIKYKNTKHKMVRTFTRSSYEQNYIFLQLAQGVHMGVLDIGLTGFQRP